MIYSGAGFLAVIWFLAHPIPPPSPVSKLSLFLTRWQSFLREDGGGGGGGGKSFNRKKACITLTGCIIRGLGPILWGVEEQVNKGT
jgi:hypothetical protein